MSIITGFTPLREDETPGVFQGKNISFKDPELQYVIGTVWQQNITWLKFMKQLLYTRSVLEEFQDWCKLNTDFLILDQALHMIIIW